MKYRKKSTVVDAFRMGIDPRPDWFQEKVTSCDITTYVVEGETDGGPFEFVETYCKIKHPQGTIQGSYGDYIVKEEDGIFAYSPVMFEQLYDAI